MIPEKGKVLISKHTKRDSLLVKVLEKEGYEIVVDTEEYKGLKCTYVIYDELVEIANKTPKVT